MNSTIKYQKIKSICFIESGMYSYKRTLQRNVKIKSTQLHLTVDPALKAFNQSWSTSVVQLVSPALISRQR